MPVLDEETERALQALDDPFAPPSVKDALALIRAAKDEEAEECRLAQCYQCKQNIGGTEHREPDGFLWWVHDGGSRCKAEAIRARIAARGKEGGKNG